MTNTVLALIGLSCGFTVSAALFALIATIGVLNRMAQMTRSAAFIRGYEVCFMAGGIIGNLLSIYHLYIYLYFFHKNLLILLRSHLFLIIKHKKIQCYICINSCKRNKNLKKYMLNNSYPSISFF